MLKKSDIVNQIGRNAYYSKSVLAQLIALYAPFGNPNDPPILKIPTGINEAIIDEYDDVHIPSIIDDIIWNTSISRKDKIDLAFSIYDDIPEYGLMSDVAIFFDQSLKSDRVYILEHIKQRLAGQNPILARPICYALAVDFFEMDSVEEAWTALTEGDVPSAVIQAALGNSVAVPWKLKIRLYQRLLSDYQWHSHIFRSLQFSVFQLRDDIEPQSALQVLHQLDLPGDASAISELEQRLLSLNAL